MNLMGPLTTRYDFSGWLYGLWSAGVSGGATVAYSAFAVILIDPTDFNLKTGKFYQMVGAMFLFGAAKKMLEVLEKKPAPDIISQDTHMDVKTTTLPLRGTGDGTVGNMPERVKTVKTTVEEQVSVKQPVQDGTGKGD